MSRSVTARHGALRHSRSGMEDRFRNGLVSYGRQEAGVLNRPVFVWQARLEPVGTGMASQARIAMSCHVEVG